MNPEIFRAFSIRGIADSELPDTVVTGIGCAIGAFFRERGGTQLTVGRDARLSSSRISNALIAGILQAGVAVEDVGLVPTPVLNFAVDQSVSDGGVMVTASHNPAEYNGLKIRGDLTLDADALQEIRRLAVEGENCTGSKQARRCFFDPVPAYKARIKEAAYHEKQMTIVVDGLNGTNGAIVPGLLRDLGHTVVEMNCMPDGTFPAGSPDPTKSGVLDALGNAVRNEGAHIGFAYDGDGDRVAVVDEKGQAVAGDRILMLLARHALSRRDDETPAVVYEVLCTQAVADDVKVHGGVPVIAPSGYFYVQQAMEKHRALLGGELSGHLFFQEPGFRFDDSILATVKILNMLAQEAHPLSKLVEDLPAYFSSDEVRLPCPDEIKSLIVEKVRQEYETDYEVDTVDGVRVHFPQGWALVRQSNTQPVISMRFEADHAGALDAIHKRVQPLVEALIEELEES